MDMMSVVPSGSDKECRDKEVNLLEIFCQLSEVSRGVGFEKFLTFSVNVEMFAKLKKS